MESITDFRRHQQCEGVQPTSFTSPKLCLMCQLIRRKVAQRKYTVAWIKPDQADDPEATDLARGEWGARYKIYIYA